MHLNLSDTPVPSFTDHFPRIARGERRWPEKGRRAPKVPAKPPGRPGNAARWMEQVQYTGPWPGIAPHKDKEREEEMHIEPPFKNCHERCRIRATRHSTCLLASPLRTSVGDMMAELVGKMQHASKRQTEKRLSEIMGVEVAWKGQADAKEVA